MTQTYTPSENAEFLASLAGTISRIGGKSEHIDHLNALAAREAEQDATYVAHLNKRVNVALESPGQLHSLDEARTIVDSWRSK